MTQLKSTFKALFTSVATIIDDGGRMMGWALVSLLLLGVIVGWLNPAKFGSYLWMISKLSLAAVLGYGFDRATAFESQPGQLDGLDKSMAQTRRASLIAACIVAAGLMP